MLKSRDLHEVSVLYNLLSHPEVFPYVRQKAMSIDEYYFTTKQTIEAEKSGELISRTILDEYNQPIGTINLFDINDNYGFLATWIGQPYFGRGYNKLAKEQFLKDLFLNSRIEAVFMKIRKTNTRSLKAVLKMPYAFIANSSYSEVYGQVNKYENVYDLYAVSKEHYVSFVHFTHTEPATDGEEAS